MLRGLVKEKIKAKEIFDQAVAKGETAGLLEQAPESSDVFSTKLGNIPAGKSVVVEIEYVGELKHHDTDGIRFTIPTKIAPRYGPGPTFSTSTNPTINAQDKDGMKITVDINMPEGSFIKGVQSPSHPIAVSMGTVSTATSADPTMSKASATLSQGSSALDMDFVLIIQSKDVGTPKAILETHPSFPNQRAIMATLVPKFALPPSRPEIVFVADRSGSMAGNIPMLISAMTVFLKSVPPGVKFNICSFGSRYNFLWPKSMTYTKETLDQAMSHVNSFSADMGGTETFKAIKATIEQRYTDIPLEIMLLTDGDISRQNELFTYLNEQVDKTKGNIRVFPLGIGSGVSHSLIEGVARAGNGFAQAVQAGERLDTAVVKMLRGALTPHITDYTLEVKYEQNNDDFELIDKVTDGMKVLLSDENPKSKKPATKPTISLFDTAVDPEKDDIKGSGDADSWLPKIASPKLLQAPHKIPSLFAFSRTSVYLLMSPETIQRNPIAVILRATSEHGPLALEIPVEKLPAPAQTIHQLAAKKAVQDLEEGRGWIFDAKDSAGVSIKAKYPSCFEDLVKREAVQLGEKFQIAGKWCSFVAVAANDKEINDKEAAQDIGDSDEEFVDGGELSPTCSFVLPSRRPQQQTEPEYESDEDIYFCEPYSSEDANVEFLFLDFDMVTKDAETAPPSYYSNSGRTSTFLKKSRTSSRSGKDYMTNSIKGTISVPEANLPKFDAEETASPPALLARLRTHRPAGPQHFDTEEAASASALIYRLRNPSEDTEANHISAHTVHASMIDAGNSQLSTSRRSTRSRSSFSPVQTLSRGGGLFGTNSPNVAPSSSTHTGGSSLFGTQQSGSPMLGMAPAQSASPFQTSHQSEKTSTGMKAFRQRIAPQSAGIASASSYAPPAPGGGLFGASSNQPAAQSFSFGNSAGFGAPPPPPAPQAANMFARSFGAPASQPDRRKESLSKKSKYQYEARSGSDEEKSASLTNWSTKSTTDKVLALIALQDFEGSWTNAKACGSIMSVDDMKAPDDVDEKVWLTLLVVKFLEMKCLDEEGTWGLVVEKAKGWLEGLGMMNLEDLEKKAGVSIS